MFTFPFTMMSSADDAYTPAGALWFDGGADYLIRDPGSSGNRRTFTFSCWLKRSELGSAGGTTGNNIFGADRTSSYSDRFMFGTADDGNDWLEFSCHDGSSGACRTSALYRDPTAWMHVLWVIDTTQSTDTNRVKLYVNGSIVAFNSPSYPAQDYDTYINYTENQAIGVRPGTLTQQHYGGYMADVILLDGTAVSDASDFGELSDGIWVPKDPSTISSFGTNGFWLDFSNGSDIGNDVSGNNNDFTPTSMGANNIAVDGPANSTNKEVTIYPVIDPVGPWGIAQNTLSNNNLTYVSGTTQDKWNYSTIPISNSDKVYMEFLLNGNSSGSAAPGFNVSKSGHPGAHGVYPGGNEQENWGLYIGNGDGSVSVRHNNSNIINNQAGGSSGDVFMFARDGASAWFGVNNTWYSSGDPTDATTGIFKSGSNPLPTDEPLWMGFSCYGSTSTTWRPYSSQWSYSPPTGFGEMKSTITGTGNVATLNPIASSTRKGGLSNGNLTASGNGKDNFSTMNIPLTGKWYFEATLTATGSDKDAVGVAEAKSDQTSAYSSTITALYGKDGTKFTSNAWSSYGDPITAGETVGVYINAGQVTFYLDGDDSQGTCGSAFTTQCFATTQNSHANTIWNLNFGQKPFIYSLPDADAKALATQNLPEPTHANPDKFMAHGEFTMGTSNHKVSISDFNPSSGCVVELLRIDSSSEWVVGNTVLGAGKHFNVSIQQGEQTDANLIHSYNSDGVTFGTTLTNGGSYYWRVHRIHADYCDVQTRTGTGSAHAESHNLNYKPGFLYCLANASSARGTYHSALGATKAVFLDDCDVPSTSSSYWNNVEPTDSQYTVGTDASTNASSVTYYDIMFTDGAGLCFFGSFTGNGIDDGPMVNMNNSQPKNVMVFRTGSNSSAYFIDYNTVRNPSNVCTRMFLLDNSGNEYSGGLESDILATGWKARDGNNGMNASEQMIISAWGLRRNSRAR